MYFPQEHSVCNTEHANDAKGGGWDGHVCLLWLRVTGTKGGGSVGVARVAIVAPPPCFRARMCACVVRVLVCVWCV